MNVNKVYLMGRLTADPELKQTQSGIAVTYFTVAITRRRQGDKPQETDFIDCVAFRSGAEFLNKYFRKGSAVIVFGRLNVDLYTTKEGEKRRAVRVIADEIQFGETKRTEETTTVFENAGAEPMFTELPSDSELPF